MNREQSALWQRIQSFEIDDPAASFPFSARLARENAWTREFALRVVDEYKRFVFLAMVADHQVTPSETVDKAWHLHLIYTQSYWNGLCREVLGRPLHHLPTRGPVDAGRHAEQYAATLSDYAAWFGQAAPCDIWPAPSTRSSALSKPRLWARTRNARSWLVAAALVPIAWGIANPLDMAGQEFLGFYIVIALFAVAVSYFLRERFRQDAEGFEQVPLQPLEVACLGQGIRGVLQSSLARLVAERKLTVIEKVPSKLGPFPLGNTSYLLRAHGLPDANASDIEKVMLTVAAQPPGALPSDILKSGKPLAEATVADLQSRGLLESASSFRWSLWCPLLIVGSVWLLGLAKVIVGISRDKPVGFLIACLLGLLFLGGLILRRPFRTRRGERLFDELKVKHEHLKSSPATDPSQVGTNDLMLMIGLFGLASIASPDIQLLNSALRSVPAGSGSGCGGGCGGSGGCGGGCGGGGCGGCGGGD